jgi:putative intracellular protease/amidase
VPVAAICGATLAVTHLGLTENRRHTSNAKAYLAAMVPTYRGGDHYAEDWAVRDGTLITASGIGSVEFAREIIAALGLYSESDQEIWWDIFKHGKMPAE